MQKELETLTEAIVSHLYAIEDYTTTHIDSGNAYMDVLIGNGCDCVLLERRLREWCKDYAPFNDEQLDQVDYEQLLAECVEVAEPAPCHIFSNLESSNCCVLDSIPIGEIEEQLCIADFVAEGCTHAMTALRFLHLENHSREVCINAAWGGNLPTYVYAYINTDAIWAARVDSTWIIEEINRQLDKE